MNSIIREFKRNERYNGWDSWGCSMVFMFNLCEYAFHNGLEIPPHWQYNPSCLLEIGKCSEELKDNLWYFVGESKETILEAGEILNRYTNYLRYKELNY